MPDLLVIDDDRAILSLVDKALRSLVNVTTATSGQLGLAAIRDGSFDAVLLDIRLPDQNGISVFAEIRKLDRRIPVIFMTVEATSATAIEAMQLGAFDYVAKPLAIEQLRNIVVKAIEQRQISSVPVAISADASTEDPSTELFIGQSPAMLDVFKAIGRIAKQDVPILVRGESGTGKELVARALYQYSHRSDESFLAVNCAALPDSLLESELFGHEKGAFTGADSRRIGKFEQCNGGTLFLDEIGDMAPSVQAKVLRVLQDQRFERVGGNTELSTDVRIIAATNRDLEAMVKQGDYREDLLYRLNGVTIELPPLRNRMSDLRPLIHAFLAQAKTEFKKPDLEGLSPEVFECLTRYDWPGNVRQLRAVIRRCVLDTVMPVITPDILPVAVTQAERQREADLDAVAGTELPELVRRLLRERSTDIYAETMRYVESYVIRQVLDATDGNQSQAAEILGITRTKLRDRIHSFNIQLKGSSTPAESPRSKAAPLLRTDDVSKNTPTRAAESRTDPDTTVGNRS